MYLFIDYREQAILRLLNIVGESVKCSEEITTITHKNIQANIKICNLDVGDFIIKDENNQICAIIERKTCNDLCSSIIDGRFREQKVRISDSIESCKVMYIIEGIKSKCRLKPNIINGCLLNLLWKHNFKVMHTLDASDTVEVIFQLYKKMSESNSDTFGPIAHVTVSNLISKKSKFYENPMVHIIQTIPGVSVRIAECISDRYKNINELLKSYIEHGELLLSEIMITEKRKIGKFLSQKIYNVLFGIK